MADRITKVTLLAQVSGYVAGLEQAKKATKDTATEADKAKAKLEAQSKVFDATGKAAIAFGAAAALGVASAVKAYAEWDAKMAQVQSLSHAGVRDMGALRDATFGFAQQFGISASQAADAEIELVKGGVSVKDMINGGLKGALTLAAAGQLDVGDATSIAVSAMTQFHLKGQDVSHVADLLAAGADKALGSVSDLGQGLKYVGPVASSMGISIEQTVGTLSELAQNGVLAEQAGTDLRGMLMSLTAPSAQASAVMKQYGINVYDAAGKFVGFDGVAQQLQKHLGGLDQATKNQALGQIFGNQQITAATILMRDGAKGVDNWTKKVDQNGFAAEQAAGKLNSLNGDLGKLKAAFQNDLVQTGEASGGVLRKLAEGATTLATAYGNLPQPLKDTALGLVAATAAVGLLGGATVVALPKLAAFDAALATMGARPNLILGGLKSVTSFLGGPWGIGLAVGVGAALAFNDALQVDAASLSAFEKQLSSGKKSFDAYQQAIKMNTNGNVAQQVKFAIPDGLSSIGLVDSTRNLKQFLDFMGDGTNKVRAFSVGALGTMTDGFMGTQQALKTFDAGLANLAGKSVPEAKKAFAEFVKQQGLSKDEQRAVLAQLPQYEAALKGQASAAKDAAAGSSEVKSSADQIASAMDSASQATDGLVQSLEGLDNGSISASEAQVQMSQAIADATAAVQSNGATLDLNTQQGRANQSALDGIASSALALIGAQAQAGSSTAQITASTQTAHDAFVAAAEAMGMSATDAQNLAAKYGLIPGNVQTLIEASGAGQAIADANAVRSAIESIPQQRVVDIIARSSLPDLNGSVSGSGRPGLANGGVISYYANGGVRSENHIAQIAPAGAWRMWAEPETGGEAYIPLAPSKRSRSIAIWEETGRRLQAFAGGGISVPSVNVAAPSLDGLSLSGRLVMDASGLVQLVDGRIHANASADARTIRNGRRRF